MSYEISLFTAKSLVSSTDSCVLLRFLAENLLPCIFDFASVTQLYAMRNCKLRLLIDKLHVDCCRTYLDTVECKFSNEFDFALPRKNLTAQTNALCISLQYTSHPSKSTLKYDGIAIR